MQILVDFKGKRSEQYWQIIILHQRLKIRKKYYFSFMAKYENVNYLTVQFMIR